MVQAEESRAAEQETLAPYQAAMIPLRTSIEQLTKLDQELKKSAQPERKNDLQAQIDAERKRLQQYRENLADLIGGSEENAFTDVVTEKRTLQDQFSDLLSPLIEAMQEPTNHLRERENLRKNFLAWENREVKAGRVVKRIQTMQKEVKDDDLFARELDDTERLWVGRLAEAQGQSELLALKLEELKKNSPTVWQSITGAMSNFWKNRGLNVLLAIVVGLVGYFSVRKIYLFIKTASPLKKRATGGLISRVSDLVSIALAVLTSIIGILLVFYLREDWLLLTLSAVLIIGAAWAAKSSIPPYMDQIRMILNLGSVREGERVVHLGLPWKVRSLGMYSDFHNPELEGGCLRLPIRDVMPMVSRQSDPKESWFPTQVGDWVLADLEIHAKVIRQTPEHVVLVKLGGSIQTYPTADFLQLKLENLSHGFRLETTVGIDYAHRLHANDDVAQKITDVVESGLINDIGHDSLKCIKVEFYQAGESSLDYRILADFDGSTAAKYRYLQRRLQALFLDACNQYGWEIPFPQLTLHQGTNR